MHEPYLYGSLTRISDLHSGNFQVGPVPRSKWEMGDYVVGESTSPPATGGSKLPTTGRA